MAIGCREVLNPNSMTRQSAHIDHMRIGGEIMHGSFIGKLTLPVTRFSRENNMIIRPF
jgi:hypothetical protein